MNRKPLRAVVVLAVWSTGAAADCNIPPPPGAPLSVDGFYADRRGRDVDPVRKAERDRAVEAYERLVREVQASADGFVERGDVSAGRCALRQLDAWAAAGPLTGRLATRQANYERNWYLAGFALAYLKLRPLEDEARRARIEAWFAAMAEGCLGAIDAGEVPGNNLLYWSGLALAAAGLATRSEPLVERGERILADGLASVSGAGLLPLETSRGRKALGYHAFAAAPLTLLAFMSRARGRPFDGQALERLGDAVLSGLAEPRRFGIAAGAPQEMPEAWNLAWLPAYRALVPGGPVPAYAPASHFLGGDVRATMAAIRAVVSR